MTKWIKNIIIDIRHGRNLESYVIILVTVIVVAMDIFNLSEPGWISEATLAVLALLAYSNIQTSRALEEVKSSTRGIRENHKFEESHEVDVIQVNRRIESARTVDWVAFTNQKTFNNYRTHITKCLSGGGKIRLLLINPYDDMPKTLAKNNYSISADPEQDYKIGVQQTLQYCKHLQREAGRGSIDIRFLTVHPPYRITIYNRDEDKGGFVRIHLLKAPNSAEAATIAWHKENDPKWFQFFVGQYELLWQTAMQIDDTGKPIDDLPQEQGRKTKIKNRKNNSQKDISG